MNDPESSQKLDIKLVVDDDDEPLEVSIQIFDILKKALFSSQDQSRTVANEFDSLLSTYLNCEQDQSQHRPNLYGFIAELVLIISQTAMQIPIHHEDLHQKLAKVVVELSQLDTVYEYEGREMSWHRLPFVEGEFEDQSHQLGPGGSREEDFRRFEFFLAVVVGLNARDPSKSSKEICGWIRWGTIALFRSLEGTSRHRHTKQLADSPIAAEHHTAWLEISGFWIEKAGIEFYRLFGLEDQGADFRGPKGPNWIRYLDKNDGKGNRWKFWMQRLQMIRDYEESEEKVRILAGKMLEKMEAIEKEGSSTFVSQTM